MSEWETVSGGPTKPQLTKLNILLIEAFGEAQRKNYLKATYGVDSSKDLTFDEASEIIERFESDDREFWIKQGHADIKEEIGQESLI